MAKPATKAAAKNPPMPDDFLLTPADKAELAQRAADKAAAQEPPAPSESEAAPAEADLPDPSDDEKKDLNIYQRINKVICEVQAIEKTGRNSQQNYSFIEQAAVVSALRPRLVAWDILIKQSVKNHELIAKAKGSKAVVTYQFEVINTNDPDDKFVDEWVGEGDDSLDKGTSKASTSAEKYYLMKLFKISDRNDPDAESYSADSGQQYDRRAAAPPARAPAPSAKTTATLPDRPADAPMDDQERTTLMRAFLKAGVDRDDMTEILHVNGIDNTKTMSSGQARSMIMKLTKNAFARPVAPPPPAHPDTVVTDIPAGPIDLPDADTLPDPQKPAEPAEPELVVDDDLKANVEEMVQQMGLSARGTMWLFQKICGKPFGKWDKLKDEEWKRAFNIVQGIFDGEYDVPDEYVAGFVGDAPDVTPPPALDPSEPLKNQVVSAAEAAAAADEEFAAEVATVFSDTKAKGTKAKGEGADNGESTNKAGQPAK